jgi:hypothetical protein
MLKTEDVLLMDAAINFHVGSGNESYATKRAV